MARIRTIKPEFWADETVGSWDPWTRLAYIALWNEADDEGRFRSSPAYLKGRIFPYDSDVDMASIINSLRAHGKLSEYSCNGQRYGVLTNFRTHQKINRPSASKLPKPEDGEPFTEGSVSVHGGLTVGKDQGKDHEPPLRPPTGGPLPADAEKVLGNFHHHTGTKVCGNGAAKKSALKKARRLLKAGWRLGDFDRVHHWIATSNHDNAVHVREKYLTPMTVWVADNFAKYHALAESAPESQTVADRYAAQAAEDARRTEEFFSEWGVQP